MPERNLKEKFSLIYQAFQNKQDNASQLLAEFLQENNRETNKVKRGANFRALINFHLPNIFMLALRNNDVESCQMLVNSGFTISSIRQFAQELHKGELNYKTRFFLIDEIYKSKNLTGSLFVENISKQELDNYMLWDIKNCMLEALNARDESFVIKLIEYGYGLDKLQIHNVSRDEEGDRIFIGKNLLEKLDSKTREFYEKCELQSLVEDDELRFTKLRKKVCPQLIKKLYTLWQCIQDRHLI